MENQIITFMEKYRKRNQITHTDARRAQIGPLIQPHYDWRL